MFNFIFELVLILPILIMAISYGLPFLVQAVSTKRHILGKDYTLEPQVSVMLPCFNEGSHVYETIKSLRNCEYPQDKLQIVAIDDCSTDDSYAWIQKAAVDFPNIIIGRNEVNSGKTRTVMRASHLTTGEILVTVDSDTVFDKHAIKELVVCFTDPKVGAVGGRVGISNTNETWISQIQTFFYYLCFFLPKSVENFVQSVSCVSGCLSSFRREPYMKIEEGLKKRNFMGIPVDDGDDRFITQAMLYGGYKTIVNNDSQCWTKSPTTLRQLFSQQLRWRRSAIRSWIIDIKTTVTGRNKVHPLGVLYLFMPLFALSTMLTLSITMYVTNSVHELIGFLVMHMGVMGLFGLIYSQVVKRKNPEQTILNPLVFVCMPAYLYVDYLFITLLAMFTLDFGGWGTRQSSPPSADLPTLP
ncbi:MAG: glycosyltransferase family 2 protein [Agitococcus sp.]|nr:glycosyltransferase family 2 protein [Agitococcus sp.]MDO9179461.1 glycosyltransferase family 2 protein [Agitococcus sp.]